MPFTRQNKEDQKETKQQRKERESAEPRKAEKGRERAEREKEKEEQREKQKTKRNSKKHSQDYEQRGAGVQLQHHKGGASVAPAKETKKRGGSWSFSRKSSTSSTNTPTPTSPHEISPRPPFSAKHPLIQPELGSSFECVPMPDDTLQNDPSLKSTSDQASLKTCGEQLQGSIRKDSQSKVQVPHPLEVTQTSSVASPTSVSSATEQSTSLDQVVFTMDDESGGNVQPQGQPLTKDQIEALQRENAKLVRRCSEAEENAKRESELRAETEESRRNEIEKILTDVTKQHKEEWKQRQAEMEKENEALIKRRKEEAEKEFESLQIKIDHATSRVTAVTGTVLKQHVKRIDELKDQLAQTKAEKEELTKVAKDWEEEIARLKQLIKESKAELTKLRSEHEKEMVAKDIELKHREAEVLDLKQENIRLDEQYRPLKVIADFIRQDQKPESGGVESSMDPFEVLKDARARAADLATTVEKQKDQIERLKQEKCEFEAHKLKLSQETSLQVNYSNKTTCYQKVQAFSDRLVKGINPVVSDIAWKAFAKNLIAKPTMKNATNETELPINRSSALMKEILDKIESNEHFFDVFLEILQEEPSLQYLVDDLRSSVSRHS